MLRDPDLRPHPRPKSVEFLAPAWLDFRRVLLMFQCGRSLLRVLLQNLVGNAWKFSSKRSLAHIEFGMQKQNGGRVFLVRDNGAGFDMAYVDGWFGPFQRLHSPRDFEGTGIGVATVARIVHRHGGRIWGENAPDKGATFYFAL
ncbi:MAG: hypothetical protein AUI47_06855 [Acidobacteria bacterium 13_1_40CM_2_68_5]|nr:MAG: hypothetical protein AUI47_06855 [Acidobacteria bacterium 13_1_40CM_2_68_5]